MQGDTQQGDTHPGESSEDGADRGATVHDGSLGGATVAHGASSDVEARLDALQEASLQRRAELRAIAAELPHATSRRAYLSAMARGIVEAPDKPTVAKRVLLKVARTPLELIRSRRT